MKNEKDSQKNDFELLINILKNTDSSQEESVLSDSLYADIKKYFKDNSLEITDFKIFVQDKINKNLKDFTRPWQTAQINEQTAKINGDFEFFKNNEKSGDELYPKLIINDVKMMSGTSISEYLKEFKTNLKENNVVTIPLSSSEGIYGIIYLEFKNDDKEKNLNKNFLQYFHVAILALSKEIKTLLYEKELLKAINFHKTMQNVTKIIETQYELNYILPILGEMIDKFISQHLIYIFLKNGKKGEFNLAWPANCTDKNLYNLLEKNSNIKTSIIENNGKVGIFPILIGDKTLGAIVAYNTFENLTNEEIEYLKELSAQASLTIDKANSYSKILQNATLDALTRLNNRHQFAHRLKQETSTAKRQNTSLCCIMLDIDYFKKVNDTYGHAVGDNVLKTVANVIRKEIRESDIASRYGGEEFTILTPNTNLEEAVLVANRLRAQIEKKKINIEEFKIEGVKEISVTISVGVSQFNKKNAEPDTLYQEADKALYAAKEGGRNRVIVYSEELNK